MKNISIMIPDLTGGGAQRAAARLSCALSERNNIKMVLLRNRDVEYEYGGELLQMGNTRAEKGSNFPELVLRLHWLRKFKRSNHIHASISFKEGASLLNILSKKDDRVIVSVRAYSFEEKASLRDRLRLRMIYGLYNRADKIIAVSRFLEKELVTKYGVHQDKIEVIYNYYDVEEIEAKACVPIEPELEALFQGPVVITAGRVVFQKGHWYLIRAFAEVLKKVPHARLVILGKGKLEEDLAYLVRELDIADRVHFLGFRDNPFQYICRSSVFVLTSLFEGFPNALCEAMACGVPVISSDCRSGPREILSPLTPFDVMTDKVDYAPYGILTPPFDGEVYSGIEPITPSEVALAQAMVSLLTDPLLKAAYAQQAKVRVMELSLGEVIRKWENLLI